MTSLARSRYALKLSLGLGLRSFSPKCTATCTAVIGAPDLWFCWSELYVSSSPVDPSQDQLQETQLRLITQPSSLVQLMSQHAPQQLPGEKGAARATAAAR